MNPTDRPQTMKTNKSIAKKKESNIKVLTLWFSLMSIYMAILLGISYIEFWEQDFNDPDKVLKKYELIR